MIFIVKGNPSDTGPLALRLAQSLNDVVPRWPVDDASLREWESTLRGWPEADTSGFHAPHIDVDQAIAWAFFERRREYPPPPPYSPTTPRRELERWRDSCGLDVLSKHLGRIFNLLCQVMESVPHPVLIGSELGTTPQDSVLTRMVLFKYSRTPHLKVLLRAAPAAEARAAQRDPVAVVYDREFPPLQLLEMIHRNPDGSLRLDPALHGAPRS